DWLDSETKIVSLEPNSLDDIWRDIRAVAEAIGLPERGDALITDLQNRMGGIATQCEAMDRPPRVACIEWIAPLMSAGNWVPELVAMAGGENLFGTAGSHSPWMEWEDLKTADPDVIVVMPCGFDIARSRAEMPALIEQSGWENLAAVKSNQVFLTDGNQYFNRPGPRVVESLEILTEVFHPKDFTPTHLGRGWEQF
ncbi:MAG TPA: cobalamin-binding protein, partial [Rhodospirillaceae bacterium]|nr:cobalamin-binding protein [Rhodospirillaceae bacterium]